MRLSSKGEYALIAMVYLARKADGDPVPTRTIASENGIPKKFLESILLTLKRAGHVASRMGPDGGYRLNRPPREISVAEVIRLIDGPLAAVGSVSKYFHTSTPIERCPALLHVFGEIRDYTAHKLESTSFADLVEMEGGTAL